MPLDIRLPNIDSNTVAGQIAQMRSYMYQMVEQLNWALSTLETGTQEAVATVLKSSSANSPDPDKALSTFNSIKSLIIKSADIIDAYSEEIKTNLSGEYVAQSEYGTYTQKTDAAIEQNSQRLSTIYTNLQSIESAVDEISSIVLSTYAYINSGELYTDGDGFPVYGLEVGQRNTYTDDETGEEVETFDKFAQFTASGVYLYNQGSDEPCAYFSNQTTHITDGEVNGTILHVDNAEINGQLWARTATIPGSLFLGGFELDTSDGIAFVW